MTAETGSKITFFSRFNRIITITYGVIFACAILLFVFSYKGDLEARKDSFRLRLIEQTQALDYLIRIRHDAVNAMRTQAEDFLKLPFKPSSLKDVRLKYSSTGGYFYLEKPPVRPNLIGNITGLGRVDTLSDKAWDEIYMSYLLNPLMRVLKQNIKTALSLRYTSKRGFQNFFPWHRVSEVRFREEILLQEFFQGALPANNPEQKIFWTDATLSPRGELIQTCAAPVFREGEFLGVVSLDFTLAAVDYFIDSINYQIGRLLVINDRGTIVSDTDTSTDVTGLRAAQDVLPDGLKLAHILDLKEYTLTQQGSFWVYRAQTDFAPWHVIFYVDVSQLAWDSFQHVAPSIVIVLIFATFFLFVTNKLIAREFIAPARKLVNHISSQGRPDTTNYDDIQEPWYAWFEAVSQVFEQNRVLVTKLEEHIHKLDEKVTLRTKELSTNNQALKKTLVDLKKAQKQIIVQEKLAGLGAITAGIAHEIKNPLHFIINFSQVSKEFVHELEASYEKVRHTKGKASDLKAALETIRTLSHNMEKIDEHAKRADAIVRSMLMHAKGGTDTQALTDINQLVHENVVLATSGFKQKGLALEVEEDFETPAPQTILFPQSIGRVFLNIIHNACDALYKKREAQGPDFKAALTLKTRTYDDVIEIRVRDNGPGISRALRKKIFDPFFSTKPSGSGTGLGLSLSLDIVINQHHGTLTLESDIGSYTEFIVRLPKKGE